MESIDVTSVVRRALPQLIRLRDTSRRQVIAAVQHNLGTGLQFSEAETLKLRSKIAPRLFGIQKTRVYTLLITPQERNEKPMDVLKSALERAEGHREFASLTSS